MTTTLAMNTPFGDPYWYMNVNNTAATSINPTHIIMPQQSYNTNMAANPYTVINNTLGIGGGQCGTFQLSQLNQGFGSFGMHSHKKDLYCEDY